MEPWNSFNYETIKSVMWRSRVDAETMQLLGDGTQSWGRPTTLIRAKASPSAAPVSSLRRSDGKVKRQTLANIMPLPNTKVYVLLCYTGRIKGWKKKRNLIRFQSETGCTRIVNYIPRKCFSVKERLPSVVRSWDDKININLTTPRRTRRDNDNGRMENKE